MRRLRRFPRASVLPRVAAAAVAAAISFTAAAGDRWVIDFEADPARDPALWTVPDPADTGGARIERIDRAAGAIGKRQSLLGDSMATETAWHEILHTSPRVRLRAGVPYEVRMRFEIADIDPGQRKERPALYLILRSRSGGPNDDTDTYGPFWRREAGARGEVGAILRPRPGVDDAYLMVGILRRAAVVIDDLEIREIDAPSPGEAIRLPPAAPGPGPAEAALARQRDRHDPRRRLEEMTVVGIFESCNGTMDEVIRCMRTQIRPDAFDWASARHSGQIETARQLGAWYTTSALEYQECYRVEAPDTWDRRWERFFDDGMTRTLAGQMNSWETFGVGGIYMCHNGAEWNGYWRDRTLAVVPVGEGICQDNIGVPPFTSAGGCFCPGCEAAFRDHLRATWDRERLRSAGIDDPAAFSFRDHALRHGLVGDRALADAVAREWIRFQNRTHRDRWFDHALALRTCADRDGRPLSLSGNQILSGLPYPLFLSPGNDIIEVERLARFPDGVPAPGGWAYRLYRASGRDERPVWFRGSSRMGPGDELMDSVLWQEAEYGEAAAHGGVRTIHLADDHWPKGTVTRAFVRNESMLSMTTGWADLVRARRSLFCNRESRARVAVASSLPTLMWAMFPALEVADQVPWQRLEEVSKALDAAHVPHDALLLGYPGLWDDIDLDDRLRRYEAVVVPAAACVSLDHADALLRYAESGGIVMVDDAFGAWNGNREPLTDALAERIAAVRAVARPWPAADPVPPADPAVFGIETDAPATLHLCPWTIAGGAAVCVHVVNYDLSMLEETIRRPGPVSIALRPAGRAADVQARLVAIDGVRELAAPEPLPDGRVRVRFDLDRPYGALVIGDLDAVARADSAIRDRAAAVRNEIRARRNAADADP